MLPAIPIFFIAIMFSNPSFEKVNTKKQKSITDMTSVIYVILSGINTIKLLVLEKFFKDALIKRYINLQMQLCHNG
jgi:ABC-type bacteriocin/lantibiotic exporter with double-glycine peptidase domain